MRISTAEFVKLAGAFQEVGRIAERNAKGKYLAVLNEQQQTLRARVNQLCTELTAKGNMETAIKIRDMLDDRPSPESDPDNAQRFPSMFRGGPVKGTP